LSDGAGAIAEDMIIMRRRDSRRVRAKPGVALAGHEVDARLKAMRSLRLKKYQP